MVGYHSEENLKMDTPKIVSMLTSNKLVFCTKNNDSFVGYYHRNGHFYGTSIVDNSPKEFMFNFTEVKFWKTLSSVWSDTIDYELLSNA
jgi:hypothetical protein